MLANVLRILAQKQVVVQSALFVDRPLHPRSNPHSIRLLKQLRVEVADDDIGFEFPLRSVAKLRDFVSAADARRAENCRCVSGKAFEDRRPEAELTETTSNGNQMVRSRIGKLQAGVRYRTSNGMGAKMRVERTGAKLDIALRLSCCQLHNYQSLYLCEGL